MANLTPQDYALRPNEEISAYNARIAGLRGDTPEQLVQTQSVINQPAIDRLKITGENLAPQSPIQYATPAPTLVPPVAGLSEPIKLTAPKDFPNLQEHKATSPHV